MKTFRLSYGILAFTFLAAQPVAAAEIEQLGEVLVSAGRVPVAAEKVGRAHTVVTRKDLEQSQTRYVADALRKVPGLAVSRTGSFGGLTQIRVRGSEANHVLVLIDGIEVAGTSAGEFDFGSLQASNIERIEVLRGAQSALYGSNATSGVIHIITKNGIRGDYQITGQMEGGSDGTALANVGFQGGSEDFDAAVSASYRRTEGFNISDFGSEKDGDRNITLDGKANWDALDNLSFDMSMRYVKRKSDTDDQDFSGGETQGLVLDTKDSVNKTNALYGSASATLSLFNDHFVQKLAGEVTDLEVRGRNSRGRNGNDDRRYHASYQGTLFFDTPSVLNAKHSLTGAFEWERETYENKEPTNDTQVKQTRDMRGYVGEYRGEFFDSLFISGAVRFDKNDDFDDAFTYSTSAAYLMSSTGTRFHGSLGTGVTNPSFFEQFGFVPGRFTGNPDLDPEKNFSWDLGAEQKFWDDRVSVGVTYFQANLENEIISTGFGTSVANENGVSKRRGLEVSADIEPIDTLTLSGAYTYLLSSDPSGVEEVRRPKHSASLSINKSFLEEKANIFFDTLYTGKMQDSEFITPGRITLRNSFVMNTGGDYQVTDQFKLYGRVENLFDSDHEEVFGYNTQGVTGFMGVKATF